MNLHQRFQIKLKGNYDRRKSGRVISKIRKGLKGNPQDRWLCACRCGDILDRTEYVLQTKFP